MRFQPTIALAVLTVALAGAAACASSAPPPPPAASATASTQQNSGDAQSTAGAAGNGTGGGATAGAGATTSSGDPTPPPPDASAGAGAGTSAVAGTTSAAAGTLPPPDPSGSTTGSPSDLLTNPAKLKECHDQGKIYDRRTATTTDPGTCGTATWPSTYTCDAPGITKAFGGLQQIKDYLSQQAAAGFQIDQCGMKPGGGSVLFMTKVDASTGAASLAIGYIETP